MKDPLSWSPFRFWPLVVVIIPVLAVLVSWTTGYLYFAYGGGGFPAPWRELVFSYSPAYTCPTILEVACIFNRIVQVNIDWVSLGVDILFYTAIGYSLVIVLSWARPAKQAGATSLVEDSISVKAF